MGPSYIVITRSFFPSNQVFLPLASDMPLDIFIKPLPNPVFFHQTLRIMKMM